ncbi:MAG: DNA alkylation repair protein [Chloroflexota bacterium]
MDAGAKLDLASVLGRLEALANPANAAGMARFGIRAKKLYGVTMPELRALAKQVGRDHELALRLWAEEARETRILATLVEDPRALDEVQMEAWAADLDSWEVCDQACQSLFARSPHAYAKALAWSERPEEFVKRAGFVLMAQLAAREKRAQDDYFAPFFDAVRREAGDGRNFVKKAISWALRHLGKRNRALNACALALADELLASTAPASRWVGADARRELRSEAVQRRLGEG